MINKINYNKLLTKNKIFWNNHNLKNFKVVILEIINHLVKI